MEDTPEKPSTTSLSRFEVLQRLIAFLGGMVLVFFGITDECPRVGAIAVGLLLMGVFTVPEAVGVIRGKN